ncbi:hypothetical protein ACLKA6_020005 [Drosophila palustris]
MSRNLSPHSPIFGPSGSGNANFLLMPSTSQQPPRTKLRPRTYLGTSPRPIATVSANANANANAYRSKEARPWAQLGK